MADGSVFGGAPWNFQSRVTAPPGSESYRICIVCGYPFPYPAYPKDLTRLTMYHGLCTPCEKTRLYSYSVIDRWIRDGAAEPSRDVDWEARGDTELNFEPHDD